MKRTLSSDDLFLLAALENILGPSKETSKENYAFFCPFDPDGMCTVKNKPKLEIKLGDTTHNKWNCWVCGTKGKSIRSLLRALRTPKDIAADVLKFVHNTKDINDAFEGEGRQNYHLSKISLPRGFVSLDPCSTDINEKRLLHYLRSRGLTAYDILKYNIGYSTSGQYDDFIIIPSYDSNNKLNYYIGKKITGKQQPLLPSISKQDVVIFESQINWNLPVVLVEGGFDAIAVKRNSSPLVGKFLTQALLKRIVESPCEDVYVALDRDALRNAVKMCEELLHYGKNLFLVKLEQGEDPAKVGFKKLTRNYFHTAEPLTLSKLMQVKMQLMYE